MHLGLRPFLPYPLMSSEANNTLSSICLSGINLDYETSIIVPITSCSLLAMIFEMILYKVELQEMYLYYLIFLACTD